MFLKLSDLNEKYNLTEVRYGFITNQFHPLWDIVGKMVIGPQPYDNLFASNPYNEPYFPGFPIKQSSLMGEWSVFLILKSNLFRRSAARCIWHRQEELPGMTSPQTAFLFKGHATRSVGGIQWIGILWAADSVVSIKGGLKLWNPVSKVWRLLVWRSTTDEKLDVKINF